MPTSPVSVCAAGDGIRLMGFGSPCNMTPSIILPCQLHYLFSALLYQRSLVAKILFFYWSRDDPLLPIFFSSTWGKFIRGCWEKSINLTYCFWHLNTHCCASLLHKGIFIELPCLFFWWFIACINILLLIASAFKIEVISKNRRRISTCQ